MNTQVEEILQFWFGEMADGFPTSDRTALWWGASDETDQLIGELFGALVRQALRGELAAWSESPRARLALIILLDQFTRSIFRSTPEAFSGDGQALALCQSGMERGHDQALEYAERQFFYMPLEHAEDLAVQDESIRCFENLLMEVPPHKKVVAQGSLDFAHQHRDQIARFGRFPHRNRVLGRDSTTEELIFLNQSNHNWGQ
ncbi:DUF924 family protein [Pontibacterium granulatum]|uniref:DUF924 family protein n=1 Tax=Pontibacterium granulatum TaxID=2036029 RepID=UPI002499E218|nr:DUF924 family protein [Pontibacterium granulatum]MDI3323510.1 DUF924 family protein [Pontibacterium granulatum]